MGKRQQNFNRRDTGGNGRGQRGDRPPLQWETETMIEQGAVRGTLNSAQAGQRRIYSISMETERNGRTSKFLRPDDISDAIEVLNQVKAKAESLQRMS